MRHWKQRGRTRTPQAIHDLVVRLARENSSWGYTRILGELEKLGVRTSRSNVMNILRGIQMDPKTDPTRGKWAEFLHAHGSTLWQCDFFARHAITPQGLLKDCFVMVFVHMLSRRVFVSTSTFKTSPQWMAEQARPTAAA